MKIVRFLQTVVDLRYAQTYESGSVHTLKEDSAMHYIKRGKCEEVSKKDIAIKQAVDNQDLEIDDDNSLESSESLGESNNSDLSERSEHVAKNRRGRPRKFF